MPNGNGRPGGGDPVAKNIRSDNIRCGTFNKLLLIFIKKVKYKRRGVIFYLTSMICLITVVWTSKYANGFEVAGKYFNGCITSKIRGG